MVKRKRYASIEALDNKLGYPCVIRCDKECYSNCKCFSMCQQWVHEPMSRQSVRPTWASEDLKFKCQGKCLNVLSCVCYVLCASVYMCFVVTCWERADLLALVCGVFCEFVTFPLVSWFRCGT